MKKVNLAFMSIVFGVLAISSVGTFNSFKIAKADEPAGDTYSLNSNEHWIMYNNADFSNNKMSATAASNGQINWRSLGIANLTHLDFTIDENLTLNAMGDWKFEALTFSSITPGQNGVFPSINGADGKIICNDSVSFEWGWTTGFCVIENVGGTVTYMKTLGTTEGTHPYVDVKPGDYDYELLRQTPYNLFNKSMTLSIDISRDDDGITFDFDLKTGSPWGHVVEFTFSYTSENAAIINDSLSVCYSRVGSSGDFNGSDHYITADFAATVDNIKGDKWESVNGFNKDGELLHATSADANTYALSKPFKGTLSTEIDLDFSALGAGWGGFAILFAGDTDDYANTTVAFDGGTTEVVYTATAGDWLSLNITNAGVNVSQCLSGVVTKIKTHNDFVEPVDGSTMDGNTYWNAFGQLTRIYIDTVEENDGLSVRIQFVGKKHASNPTGKDYTVSFKVASTNLLGTQRIKVFNLANGATPTIANNSLKLNVATYPVNVTFMSDGSLYERKVVNAGLQITAPTNNPTKTGGYAFDGWYTADTGGSKITTFPLADLDVTYYAHFVATNFTVSIAPNEEDFGEVDFTSITDVVYGTAYSTSGNVLTVGETDVTATAKEGYKFDSWSVTSGTVTADMDITANFVSDIVTHSITISPNEEEFGSVDVETLTEVPEGTAYSTSNNVLTIGDVDITATPKTSDAQYTYAFDSWSVTSGTVVEDMDITANFTRTLNKYDVSISSSNSTYGTVDVSSLQAGYGDAISVNGNVLTIGDVDITATPTTSTAEYTYAFVGWGTLPEKVTEDLDITATFSQSLNKYNVIWHRDLDVELSGDYTRGEVDYGTTIVPPTNATKPASDDYYYTFDGWYDQEEGGSKVTSFGTVDGNKDYYARFIPTLKKYTVLWHYADDVTLEGDYTKGEVDKYTEIIAPSKVTKPSDEEYVYTFDGWYDQEEGGNKITEFGVVDGNKDYYARFNEEAIKYEIKFVSDGEIYASYNLSYNQQINKPSVDPTKPEDASATYVFEGWYTSEEGGSKVTNFPKVTGKATYYAHFSATAKKYTATFKNGSDVFYSQNLEYGLQIVPPSNNPTKQATEEYTYVFEGWYTAESGGSKVTNFPIITNDVTYFAHYTSKARLYTVTFNSDGGTLIDSQEVEYGDYATAPETNPTKDGFKFSGWFLDDEKFDFETPIECDTELKAHWEAVGSNNGGMIALIVVLSIVGLAAIGAIIFVAIKFGHKPGSGNTPKGGKFKNIKLRKKYSSGPTKE